MAQDLDPTKARPASIHWIHLLVQARTRCRICFTQGRRDPESLIGPHVNLPRPRYQQPAVRDALREHIRAEHPEWEGAVDWRMER